MQLDAQAQQQIRQYLLGRLPLKQQSELEEILLSDDDWYEEIQVVEDELVDEYLRDELSQTDRTSFESHFLTSPEHQEKARFASSLRRYVAAQGNDVEPVIEGSNTRIAHNRTSRLFGFLPVHNPALEYALAVVALLIIVGVGWWGAKNWTAPPQPGNVFGVELSPALTTRGQSDATTQVLIAPDVDTLRLRLLIPENSYQSYEASLIDADSHVVTTKSGLKLQLINSQRVVVFDVDAARLPAGDYRIKLSGATSNGNSEPLAGYSFRVKNR